MKAFFLSFFLMIVCFSGGAFADEKSAYEKILESGEIRCGYVVWPPMFIKDPNTGEFSGIFHDYMEAAAKSLGFKVSWVEEVTPAGYVEALRMKRFDMLCSADWPNASRGKYLGYSDPIVYLALVPFVREGDTRFDNDLSSINDENVTISVIDGEMSSIIAKSDFPKAKVTELPQMANVGQMLMNVADGKADITVTDVVAGLEYMKNNPGKLHQVETEKPVRLFPNTLSMNIGEYELREMMNTVTRELMYSGVIDNIVDRYEEYPGSMYRVKMPYEKP